MKHGLILPLVLLLAFLLHADDTGVTGTHGYTPDYYVPVTDKAVLENIESFRDLKLGLMMHFGVYNQVGIGESWGLIDQSTWRSRTMSNLGDGDDFKRMYHDWYPTYKPAEDIVQFSPKLDQTKGVCWRVWQVKGTGERMIEAEADLWQGVSTNRDEQLALDQAEKLAACLDTVRARYPDASLTCRFKTPLRPESWAAEYIAAKFTSLQAKGH